MVDLPHRALTKALRQAHTDCCSEVLIEDVNGTPWINIASRTHAEGSIACLRTGTPSGILSEWMSPRMVKSARNRKGCS